MRVGSVLREDPTRLQPLLGAPSGLEWDVCKKQESVAQSNWVSGLPKVTLQWPDPGFSDVQTRTHSGFIHC